MADDIQHLRSTGRFDSSELTRLTRGDYVPVPVDELEDAFSEWDENAPIAQLARGSQPHALPTSSRTTTLSDPETTSRLAKASQRMGVPQNLEEALLALTDGIPEPAW
jgi:hypothetical protein